MIALLSPPSSGLDVLLGRIAEGVQPSRRRRPTTTTDASAPSTPMQPGTDSPCPVVSEHVPKKNAGEETAEACRQSARAVGPDNRVGERCSGSRRSSERPDAESEEARTLIAADVCGQGLLNFRRVGAGHRTMFAGAEEDLLLQQVNACRHMKDGPKAVVMAARKEVAEGQAYNDSVLSVAAAAVNHGALNKKGLALSATVAGNNRKKPSHCIGGAFAGGLTAGGVGKENYCP